LRGLERKDIIKSEIKRTSEEEEGPIHTSERGKGKLRFLYITKRKRRQTRENPREGPKRLGARLAVVIQELRRQLSSEGGGDTQKRRKRKVTKESSVQKF